MNLSWNEIEMQAELDAEQLGIRQSLQAGLWKKRHRCYESQAKNLRILGSLIFKDDRVILPQQLRNKAFKIAHQGHMGAASMKRILRNHFWWPGPSKDAETHVKQCETCLRLSRKNAPLPLTSRVLPQGPWEILQIDFFTDQDFDNGEFLVIVDTYSRYLHVVEMDRIDAEATNEALMRVFEVWGYPLAVHSDNGPPFQSDKFVKTWEDRGVNSRKSIPLCPQSNGVVERYNKDVKETLAASKLDKSNWRTALDKYLYMHNKVRPLSRLGVTPFELLVGWKCRGTFPFLWKTPENVDRINIREKDALSKLESKKYADKKRGAKISVIAVCDRVLIAQRKRHKSDHTFSADRFTVIARDGAKVVIRSDRGVQYSRNIQDVKKVFTYLQTEPEIISEEIEEENNSLLDVAEDTQQRESQHDVDWHTLISDSIEDTYDTLSTRPRRIIKKPNRFKDMILYTVFE
ncbi:uncharacterized protein K02A2.6-like [Malaya genurostris]|uniref:uncharacterized protein K02A2.6-like n=1 Tax=Malaya genurostris TaxID=325434 RepID=UPI0026F3A68F|nr:uncharacterized protein K02A2.6-like [Malaya genurostris]XP_058455306.1 uncharacterized protein K02A2.6-like [Malaya genurostris]